MDSTTQQQYCNIHQTQHASDSLLDRVWNRISHSMDRKSIEENSQIQQKILQEQRQLEIQNLSRRSSDVTRMVMRYVF